MAKPKRRRIAGVRWVWRWLSYGIVIFTSLVCIASPAMWVRSYFDWDEVRWHKVAYHTNGPGMGKLVMPVKEYTATLKTWNGEIEFECYLIVLWNRGSDGVMFMFVNPQGFSYGKYNPISASWGPEYRTSASPDEKTTSWNWGPFMYRWSAATEGARDLYIEMPWWLVVLVAVPLPATRLRMLIRSRKSTSWKSNGCCGNCGYDLRATPAKCPECGTAVSGKAEP